MRKFIDAVEKNKELILDTERYIWKNPETGYREKKTSAKNYGDRIDYREDGNVTARIN